MILVKRIMTIQISFSFPSRGSFVTQSTIIQVQNANPRIIMDRTIAWNSGASMSDLHGHIQHIQVGASG